MKEEKKVTVKKKRAVGKSVVDTVKEKKTMRVEDIEFVEPNRDIIPEAYVDPTRKFINAMSQGELPPEAKGKILFVFHRETGHRLISFKEIMQERKHAFQIWAKTEAYALELFMKRTKWKKYKGDTPCPIPREVKV